MVTPSGSFPAGSPAAAALGASENGLYVDYDLQDPAVVRTILAHLARSGTPKPPGPAPPAPAALA